MRATVAFTGNMLHAQHAALALHESGILSAYVTSSLTRDNLIARMLRSLPSSWSQQLEEQLARRYVVNLPAEKVRSYPFWEVARTLAEKSGASRLIVDMIWDIQSHRFDAFVSRRYVPDSDLIQCFEYTAQNCFEVANDRGIAKVLHLPSLSNVTYRDLLRREHEMWPQLSENRHDKYFERKFAERQERRDKEIALADILICNSKLTARSHIKAGAEAAKVFVVPLGGPEPIATAGGDPMRPTTSPLRVMYAGPFSIRKGAHYLLQSWQRLRAGPNATLDVFGALTEPNILGVENINGVVFHGSVPKSVLYAAYEQSDVLIFPTLSDGFGMVISEALAHGCPVITTDQAGASDLISADCGRVLPAGDISALTDALQWCLDNRLQLAEMRQYALNKARSHQWIDFRSNLRAFLKKGLNERGYNFLAEQVT